MSFGDAVVCFDLDDTLVSESDYVESGLLAAGDGLDAALPGDFASGAWLVGLWRRERARDAFQRLLQVRQLDEQAWLPRLKALYRAHVPALRLREGARELIEQIVAEGGRLALVSDGYADVQRVKWASLRLEAAFDPVIFTDERGRAFWKPNPWAFEQVMAAHPDRRRFVYVADNPAKDFVGPNGLGWTTVLVRDARNLHPAPPVEGDAAPDYCVDSLARVAHVACDPLARSVPGLPTAGHRCFACGPIMFHCERPGALITGETRMTVEFHSRVQARSARVAVIGQGYVGLPLALVFCEAGFPVTGFDVDARKIDALRRGESYIKHIGAERVSAAVASGRFIATTDFDRLRECDAVLICVPTPLGEHREPDNSAIHATGRRVAQTLRPGQLVVLESTTYPGTTDQELLPILAESGLRCPEDFLLAFSPEREDPGRKNFTTKSIPKVVGGVNAASTEAAAALYGAALDRVVPVSSSRVAESAKLLENVFRSVNIALVNELKMIFERMDIDVWEVIRAAETKPFGFMPFYPGPGLGGHCIPLDPFYLSWKAAEHGEWARFIELAGEINTRQPRRVVDRVADALNGDRKPLNGSRVLVLGLAYKANIDDDRESPSYEIIELLKEHGALVDYCDPFFPSARKGRKYDLRLESVPCTAETFARYDAVLVATAHDVFKDRALFRDVPLVVDTRNMMAALIGQPGTGPGRIVKA